jgi:hypothetical protein
LTSYLDSLGQDGPRARLLDEAVDDVMVTLESLSPLTSRLAADYIERMARPMPALSGPAGALVVARAYAAHLAVEADPTRFGAVDVPVLGTLPRLRRNGSAPQDLLLRVVKATRRGFELIRAVSTPVWDGFVHCTADRVAVDVPLASIDGLARVGWVLRQVDIHYGLSPVTVKR